ncbi:MAG TPA: hypothetical protein DCS43_11705 [Verrucomicrobia bacterium]|nr:hypothetical protein [Verrucomicrobiota bacterium]
MKSAASSRVPDAASAIASLPLRGGKRLVRLQLIACLATVSAAHFMDLGPEAESIMLILVASMLSVILTTPIVIKVAFLLGAVDHPDARRIHSTPTPRIGGVAVGFGVLIALVLTSYRFMPNIQAMLIGSFVMLLVGVMDDIRQMRASLKLSMQLIACALVIASGIHISFLPPTGWGTIGRWLITAIWIIGITNAINFLDGMDGLVSGLVASTGLVYLILSLFLGSNILSYTSAALIGATLGFLGYNLKPARVFLGDGGSTFLGFFVAVLSVQGSWAEDNPLVSFCIPLLVLSVPIYDMIFTTVARILRGDVYSFKTWIEYTGKDHLHHRMEALGLTRGYVVTLICFLNLAVGIGAVALLKAPTHIGIALVVQAICIYAIIAILEIMGRKKQTT